MSSKQKQRSGTRRKQLLLPPKKALFELPALLETLSQAVHPRWAWCLMPRASLCLQDKEQLWAGGSAGPKPDPAQGLSAPWERFSSLRSFITSHTPCRATQLNPAVAATARRAQCHSAGTSARGPALQMDAAEEKLLTWIFEKDQGHCLQQEMTGSCIHWDKKKIAGEKNTKPSPIFLLSPIGISCAFTTRDHGPLHPSSHSFSFYCKNLLLQQACQQPVWIPVLITILLITLPGHLAIKHAEWTSKNISLPIQKNIIMQFILSSCQYNMQCYLFDGLIVLNYSFLQH